MSVRIRLEKPSTTVAQLGLKPGGDVHKFFMVRAREFMIPYVPYRDFGSFVDAIEQGTNFEQSKYTFKLAYAAKLYYGRTTSGKDINYTKRPHPMAGPFWDNRMMQDKGDQLANETGKYLRSRYG